MVVHLRLGPPVRPESLLTGTLLARPKVQASSCPDSGTDHDLTHSWPKVRVSRHAKRAPGPSGQASGCVPGVYGRMVAWPSGKAEDCKSFIPSSILGAAFNWNRTFGSGFPSLTFCRLAPNLKCGYGIVAITSVFQTEEMGSIPIIRCKANPEQSQNRRFAKLGRKSRKGVWPGNQLWST